MADASTSYLVEVELRTIGDLVDGKVLGSVGHLNDSLEQSKGKAQSLGSAFRDFGADASDAFTGAIEKAGALAMTGAKIAGAAALGGAVYGVMGLNKELETTQYSIAAILDVAGKSSTFADGLSSAGDIMGKMRKDAAALPGEFSDLIGIFRSISTSGFNSGMNTEALEKMSAQAMAAGAVMGLRSDMVGRELAQALEGRVGAHNVFATRLGITGADAHKFKSEKPEQRVEALQKALGRYQGAVNAFGNTFEASWTAALDNGKKFLGDTSMPLFGAIKNELRNFNDWFDNNQGTVSEWSHRIGSFLVDGFYEGKRVLLEYGPAFIDFAENAYDKLRQIWIDVQPYIESVGASVKEALKDPGTIDKILDALKLYAAIKVGGGLAGAFGGIAKAGAGLGALGDLGGAAAGVGGLASAAGGAALALGVLAAALGDVVLLYEAYSEHRAAVAEVNTMMHQQAISLVDNMAKWDTATGKIDMASKQFQDAMADVGNNTGTFMDDIRLAGESSAELAQELLSCAAAAHNAAIDFAKKRFTDDDPGGPDPFGPAHLAFATGAGVAAAKEAKKAAGMPAGGGNTTINVTMTISSNQAPGQIARRVVSELARLKRDPKASRNVQNFSGAR